LFGKPPFTAANHIDLLKLIQSTPFKLPKHPNPISATTEDFLKRTLVVNVSKRISWEELFKHPITHFLEDKIERELQETLRDDQKLQMNVSRFYAKNNKVISHINEFNDKEELNNYALGLVQKEGNGKE